MGRIVKLIGSGIGLASEAIHHHRNRSQSGRSPSPNPGQSSSSTVRAIPDAPPEYVEADESYAQELIRSGQAVEFGQSPEGTGSEKDKNSKAREAGYADEKDDDSSSEDELADDEAAWELDEMAERVAPPSYESSEEAALPTSDDSEEVKMKKEEKLVQSLVQMAGPPPVPTQRLPCPVIIPQRRPRNKARGFVRAYAPSLHDCGISQDVFLKFMSDWDGASKADPWIEVVMVAANVVGFVPEVAAQVVSAVVNVAAGTAKELQSRHRRNSFLDRVNQDLLMPRGLFAMVMTFKDELPNQQQSGPLSRLSGTLGAAFFQSERLDINQTAAKYSNLDPEISKMKKGLQSIRLSSGKTYTQLELPEAAALVYPDLDKAAQRDADGSGEGSVKELAKPGMKEKWKSAGNFVQDYFDRKAQASYEAEHQGSALAVPASGRQEFHSRFSDPNHPANSGSLISLLTGGAVNPAERRSNRRQARWERKNVRRVAMGRAPRTSRRDRRGKRQGVIKKLLRQDVLYFIVVNLPSEAEVQQSVNQIEEVMARQGLTA